jgi:hypothetical protein
MRFAARIPPSARGVLARHGSLVAGILAAVFALQAGGQLARLAHNFDEGLYIQQAALVRAGQRPYADFLEHQTPLYIYALAAFSLPSPASLLLHRLLSLLATAATGVVVFHAGRRLTTPGAALVAQVLFYFASLQQYGLLAMPNALMELFVALGMFGAVFRDERWAVGAGALALVASLLFKPLSLPAVLAAGLIVLAAPDRRRRLAPFLAAGLAAGVVAWGGLHVASGGAFTELVRLQVSRISVKGGFELLSHMSGLRTAAAARGVHTAIGWNLSEHRMAFLSNVPWNTGPELLAAAACGALTLVRRAAGGARPRHLALAPVLWAAVPFVFSVFVWEPVWDHYFVQYLAPLSLLAAVALGAAWAARVSARPLIRAALALGLAAYVALGVVARRIDLPWLARAREIAAERRPLFTFDPLLAFMAGGPPACGTIDPLNVYGDYSAAALDPHGPLGRFKQTAADVIACLQRSPEVSIVVDAYFFWFVDDPLRRYVAGADPQRVVFFLPADRLRLDEAAGSGPIGEHGVRGAEEEHPAAHESPPRRRVAEAGELAYQGTPGHQRRDDPASGITRPGHVVEHEEDARSRRQAVDVPQRARRVRGVPAEGPHLAPIDVVVVGEVGGHPPVVDRDEIELVAVDLDLAHGLGQALAAPEVGLGGVTGRDHVAAEYEGHEEHRGVDAPDPARSGEGPREEHPVREEEGRGGDEAARGQQQVLTDQDADRGDHPRGEPPQGGQRRLAGEQLRAAPPRIEQRQEEEPEDQQVEDGREHAAVGQRGAEEQELLGQDSRQADVGDLPIRNGRSAQAEEERDEIR